MYQCMVTGFLESFLEYASNDLRMFANHLKKIKRIRVTAKSPGSLSKDVSLDDQTYAVGSLSIQIRNPKTSLLLFSNGKLKVSGGFGEYDETKLHNLSRSEFEEWLWVNRIKPSLDVMEIEIFRSDIEIKVFLLNALHKNTKISCDSYVGLCNYIQEKHIYPNMIMPSAFSENQYIRQKKGRIIAVKLYTDTNRKSSIHFDHSGKIQLFAFDSPSDIANQCTILDSIVDDFYTK